MGLAEDKFDEMTHDETFAAAREAQDAADSVGTRHEWLRGEVKRLQDQVIRLEQDFGLWQAGIESRLIDLETPETED